MVRKFFTWRVLHLLNCIMHAKPRIGLGTLDSPIRPALSLGKLSVFFRVELKI